MPRRPPEIHPDIPLYLVPHIVARELRKHGDEVESFTVTATRRHFYNIRIRTSPVPKELREDNNLPGNA